MWKKSQMKINRTSKMFKKSNNKSNNNNNYYNYNKCNSENNLI